MYKVTYSCTSPNFIAEFDVYWFEKPRYSDVDDHQIMHILRMHTGPFKTIRYTQPMWVENA